MKALRFLKAKWQNIAIVLLLLNLLIGTALPALAEAIRVQAQPALNDISDVNVPTPTDDDVLSWDDGASEWVDRAIVEMGEHGNEYHDPDFADITTAAIDLYVDAGSGDDGNAGTSGSPKETILGALDSLPVTIAHICTIHVRGQQNYPENNEMLVFSRFNTLSKIVIKAVNANDEDMYDAGLATGGGNTYLDDSGGGWSADQFDGAYLFIFAGTGIGQIRTISGTAATRITVSVAWTANPDATSRYVVCGGATMTGTDGYHVYVEHKNVDLFGFKHTGATSWDVRHALYGSGVSNYGHHADANGIYSTYFSRVSAYYNYYDGQTRGSGVAYFAYLFVRGSIIKDCATGVFISDGSICGMTSSAAYLNYLDNCTVGISIDRHSGCIRAGSQVFNLCGDDILPDPSSAVPAWWD